MRIGVFSDSHGNIEALKTAILAAGELDCLVHCGDHFDDLKTLSEWIHCPIYGVVGNIDPVRSAPLEVTFNVGEVLIYVTHGHLLDVKYNYQKLFYKALEKGAKLALFGHTHIPICQTHEGVTLFNPGSVGRPHHGMAPTFGVVEIDQNILNCRTFYLK